MSYKTGAAKRAREETSAASRKRACAARAEQPGTSDGQPSAIAFIDRNVSTGRLEMPAGLKDFSAVWNEVLSLGDQMINLGNVGSPQ